MGACLNFVLTWVLPLYHVRVRVYMRLLISWICRVAFLSYRHESCVLGYGSSARATQPFPCVNTTTRCLSLSRSVFVQIWVWKLPPLMPPPRDDQYISLSPTESPVDDAEIESGAAALGPASQVECQELRKGLTRLPADTPRTPGSRSVDFQQFCDRLRTDLPGDSHGRGSFDTSARFVAGDPGARFGDTAPLEYEVTGEIGHPHWELIFEYVLRQCGYLVDFHTVYVMVDNRELANHKRQDPSLPHWPAAARWWHSRLKLIGPHKGHTMCTPPGQALSCWLPWWQCFLGSTLYCLIAIVYLLLCLKLKTCGRRPSWRDIQHIQKVAFQRRTHCGPSHDFAQIHGLCTHSIVSAALEWGKGLLWLLNHTPNSMLGLLWSFDPLTHHSLTGMPGHSASGVPQVQFLMRNSRTKPPIWLRPSGTELVSFLCVRALPVSLALMRRRSGFNLVWRFRLWWARVYSTPWTSAWHGHWLVNGYPGSSFLSLKAPGPDMGPPSELSMPFTSDCGVGTSSLWTRCPSIPADDAWSRTGPQSPGRSYVPGHGSCRRPSETSYYSCLWRSQGRYGKISCLDCTWRVDSYSGCYARHRG